MHGWLAARIITSRCETRITLDCLLLFWHFSRCAVRFTASFSSTSPDCLSLSAFFFPGFDLTCPLFLLLVFYNASFN